MRDYCYLVFDRKGIRRMTKTKTPKLGPNERVVRINIHVDDRAFAPPPTLTTSINVGVEHVGLPTVTAEPAELSVPAEKE